MHYVYENKTVTISEMIKFCDSIVYMQIPEHELETMADREGDL